MARYADDFVILSIAAVALGHSPLALMWRAGVPGVLEATIENREGKIGKQR